MAYIISFISDFIVEHGGQLQATMETFFQLIGLNPMQENNYKPKY